jgi:hypothetical protein
MANETRKRLATLADDPNALDDWIEQLIEDGDPQLPEVARWAAERSDTELLIRLLDDYVIHCNLRTVEAIRETLSSTGDALSRRIGEMMAHDAAEERRAGALFAGLLRLEGLAPRLVAALEDGYFLTRMEAANALGELRYVPAIAALREALADEDILTRGAAIEALTRIPDPELLTAYTGRFVDEPPEFHRGAFDDAVPRARAHAIRTLRDHRPPCAREALTFYVRTWEDPEAEDEPTKEDLEVLELARSVLAAL